MLGLVLIKELNWIESQLKIIKDPRKKVRQVNVDPRFCDSTVTGAEWDDSDQIGLRPFSRIINL